MTLIRTADLEVEDRDVPLRSRKMIIKLEFTHGCFRISPSFLFIFVFVIASHFIILCHVRSLKKILRVIGINLDLSRCVLT